MEILSILLQYNSTGSAPVNSIVSNNFGITNMSGLYDAGLSVAKQLVAICTPVVGLALLIKMFMIITKIFNERTVDFFDLFKTFLLILFLFQYVEIMTQINGLLKIGRAHV